MAATCTFCFHGSLGGFLPYAKRDVAFPYPFFGKPSVKDAMEALGVPHPMVYQIRVNSDYVGFDYHLQTQDAVEVFPKENFSPHAAAFKLQPPLPDPPRFLLDGHLGTLAKALRMLGLDTVYGKTLDDTALADLAEKEERILLSRDVGLLKRKRVVWGYWLRSQHLEEQLREVIMYFGLKGNFKPFSRCLSCNGLLVEVPKAAVEDQLPPKTKLYFQDFHQCRSCHRVYWKGSHYDRMQQFLGRILNKPNPNGESRKL